MMERLQAKVAASQALNIEVVQAGFLPTSTRGGWPMSCTRVGLCITCPTFGSQ